jgi:uncharacterized repeat protein (TIGR03943 family)
MTRLPSSPNSSKIQALEILDTLALFAWGALLLYYWFSRQLQLLIHPNYFGLVLGSGLVLVLLALAKVGQKMQKKSPSPQVQHLTLLPSGWGSGLLLAAALAGFLIAPRPLSSEMALKRGVADSLPVTRLQTQNFRATVKPEERSLIDWVRTLDAYPEPDAYKGQKVKVTGFVINVPYLGENYFLLSRFILTCCAVDAYPVALPVKLEASRSPYPNDTWLEISGEMTTEILNTGSSQKRQLVIAAKTVKPIPTPADPYGY